MLQENTDGSPSLNKAQISHWESVTLHSVTIAFSFSFPFLTFHNFKNLQSSQNIYQAYIMAKKKSQ